MKLVIKLNPDPEKYAEISQAIHDNDEYCCCAIVKSPSTKCMCKDFRDQKTYGFCHCGRYYKVPKCKVITLCGSTKFKEDFIRMQKILTLEGNIVISVGVFGHADGVVFDESTKEMLDDIHKAKIEMSDAIYVINKDGYIGKSTKSEIEWAQELGKEIFYMEEPENEV